MTKIKQQGCVIWITGLSGAGKTTLAGEIVKNIRNTQRQVLSIDGDELREVFGSVTDYNRTSRLKLANKYSKLCFLIAKQGFNVVIATISLFKEVHLWNRNSIPNYFEVYLKIPMEILKQRDSKGIYKKYDKGLLENVAGLDLSIDQPTNADWVEEFNPKRKSPLIAEEILNYLEREKKL